MMGKIRVIHFTIANTAGGVTKSVFELWKYIDRERFHFDFVTMSDKLDFADELEKEAASLWLLLCARSFSGGCPASYPQGLL